MSCSVCGLFFAPVESDSFRAHRRFHGAFTVLAACEATDLPVTRTGTGTDNVRGGSSKDIPSRSLEATSRRS